MVQAKIQQILQHYNTLWVLIYQLDSSNPKPSNLKQAQWPCSKIKSKPNMFIYD